MSLHIKSNGTSTRIQCVLPDDILDGPVSAVGTFNDGCLAPTSWYAAATVRGA